MVFAAGADVCRVTVAGPGRQADLALPAHVPLADLLPVIAGYAGVDRAAAARAPGGWVLQRLGEPPLAPQVTAAQAGLADGDLLYLRPAAMGLPTAACDDIADAVTGIHAGPGRWETADARRGGRIAAAVLLAAGAVAIARSGPPWPGPAAIAAVTAAVLLLAAVVASRAAGDRGTGAVLGCAALPYAFLAGLAATARNGPLGHGGVLGALAGFAATMAVAVLAAAGVEDGLAVFGGPAVAALAGTAGAWLAGTVPAAGPAGASAVVAVICLALTPLVPAAAFRLARVRLPAVPATAADLRDDAMLAPEPDVPRRAAAADRIVTAATCALALTSAGAVVMLGRGGGLLDPVTGIVLACALLLRSRLFRGRAQRGWLLAAGYAGLAWIAAASATGGGSASLPAGMASRVAAPAHLGVVMLLVTAGAVVLAAAGSHLASHRPSPVWGRAAELADWLVMIGLLPLALDAAGVFGRVHGLGG